jgi:GT2 family glycosyltransferase
MRTESYKPSVVVVTLNWNGLRDTIECLESLFKCDYPHETVVVDNGSSDGSVRVLLSKYRDEIHLIANRANLGYSKGMNIGLSYAFEDRKADYCLVMNNDTKADPKFITSLVEAAERYGDAGFVTGKVYYYDNPEVFQTVGKKYHPVTLNGGHIGRNEKDEGQFDKEGQLAFCDDIFWLISKKVWDKVGGYDPEFFLQSEDFEWQIRAKKAGFKIYFTPEAKIWHKESMQLGKASPRKLFYDTRNPIIAIFKHMDMEFCHRYFNIYWRENVLKPIIRYCIRLKPAFAWEIGRGFASFAIWYIKLGKTHNA